MQLSDLFRIVEHIATILLMTAFVVSLVFFGAWVFSRNGMEGVVVISGGVAVVVFAISYFFMRNREKYLQKARQLEKIKKELEEAKQVLEIKVRARTKELQEVNDDLERRVREKTKELQDRVKELEQFHRLTVGRELKMIELKKKMKEVKQELEQVGEHD